MKSSRVGKMIFAAVHWIRTQFDLSILIYTTKNFSSTSFLHNLILQATRRSFSLSLDLPRISQQPAPTKAATTNLILPLHQHFHHETLSKPHLHTSHQPQSFETQQLTRTNQQTSFIDPVTALFIKQRHTAAIAIPSPQST